MLRFVVCVALMSVAVSATSYTQYSSSSYKPSWGSSSSKFLRGTSYGSAPSFSYSAAPAYTVAAAPAYTVAAAPQVAYISAAPAVAAAPLAVAAAPVAAASSYETTGPITAAVQSTRTVKTYDVPSTYSSSQPLTIDVPSSPQSMNFLMRSRSSNINLETVHEPTQGSFKETASEEEPHISRHTVTRPLIQEVREVVTPYRKIVQELQPVQENVETIVPRGQYQEQSYAAPVAVAQAAPAVAVAAPAVAVAQPAVAVAQPATVALAPQPVAVAQQVQYVQPVSTYTTAPLVGGFGGSSYISSLSSPRSTYSNWSTGYKPWSK